MEPVNVQDNSLSRPIRMHFSGIGGTAMVAGARLALALGCEVRGSDNSLYPPTSEMVNALGVPVMTGYASENLDWNPDWVIIGNALSRGNPEVEAVLSRRIPYLSLPEWLKRNVLQFRRPIVFTGTHGKTTTSALAAHVLDESGLEPGFFIGGQPLGFQHSSRLGKPGGIFVIEGDEYDTAFFDKRAKFFHYLPEIVVVTSIEFDHADIYRDLAEIDLAFQRMLRQIPQEGWLVYCADNRAAELLPHAPCQTISYGFSESANWRAKIKNGTKSGKFEVFHSGEFWGMVEGPYYGNHTILNALAVIAVSAISGIGREEILAGLRSFSGVKRRMEVFLEAKGAVFIDDFAHHPTAIRETIAAARLRWPDSRLRVLFEPRSNTTTTRQFQQELEDAFFQADDVLLGPINRPHLIPEEMRLNREELIRNLTENGCTGMYADDPMVLARHVLDTLKNGDVILILSNGGFGGIYKYFRDSIA